MDGIDGGGAAAVDSGGGGGESAGGGGGDTGGSSEPTGGHVASGGHEGGSGGEGGGESTATPSTEAEATGAAPAADDVQRWAVGEEQLSADDMHKRLSPDYEHVLKANGGEHRMNQATLYRNAQLGLGAHSKMSEAADLRKSAQDMYDRFRDDPWSTLDDVLDPAKYPGGANDLAMERLRGTFERDRQLEALQQSDPYAYRQAIQDDTRKQMETRQARETAKAEREASQQRQNEERRQYAQSIPRALEAAGLKHTPSTHAHLARVVQQYQQVGHNLSVEDAAHMAKQAYNTEMQGHVRNLKPAELMALLGDDARKALRESEISQMKPTKAKPAAANDNGGSAPKKLKLGQAPQRMSDVLKGI